MFATVNEAVEEIKAGRMVVVVDDEDRENEGGLTLAAEFVTPEAINFMAKFGRGLIWLRRGRTIRGRGIGDRAQRIDHLRPLGVVLQGIERALGLIGRQHIGLTGG